MSVVEVILTFLIILFNPDLIHQGVDESWRIRHLAREDDGDGAKFTRNMLHVLKHMAVTNSGRFKKANREQS